MKNEAFPEKFRFPFVLTSTVVTDVPKKRPVKPSARPLLVESSLLKTSLKSTVPPAGSRSSEARAGSSPASSAAAETARIKGRGEDLDRGFFIRLGWVFGD